MEYIVDEDGNLRTYLDGKLHSYEAKDESFARPAVIYTNGSKVWYQNGKCHRDNDLPASISANGDQYWYQNGKRHRDNDLPAIIKANGDQYWYQNGELHRDKVDNSYSALPAIICTNGYAAWCINGRRIKKCSDYFPIKSKSARK